MIFGFPSTYAYFTQQKESIESSCDVGKADCYADYKLPSSHINSINQVHGNSSAESMGLIVVVNGVEDKRLVSILYRSPAQSSMLMHTA